MSLVALAGDTVSITVADHPCTSTTKCESAILDVLVGGIGVHYVAGGTEAHKFTEDSDGDCMEILHSGVLSPNTSTVYVYPNGAPVQIARAGDTYTGCGAIGPSTVNYTVYAD